MLKVVLALACLVGLAAPAAAQATVDPVELLVRRAEDALNAADRAAFTRLFDPAIEQRAAAYAADLFTAGAVRSVVRERDRAALEGVPPGEGFRLVVEFFVQTAGKARILTSNLDLRRPPGGDADSWRIVTAEGLTSVEGLYRLRLNTQQPLAARNFEIASEDLSILLPEGTVFLVESDDGVTGLVLLGRGEMRFAPSPASERGQLRIFADTERLDAQFDSAYIRLSPTDYQRRVSTSSLSPAAADQRLVRRAETVFARESPKSFSVDLQDFSREAWHLLPPVDDFLAEVNTRRHDTLTYSRSLAQAEDISLFQREQRRTIALYPSVAKLAARGRFYSDDALREYDVLDYNVEASVHPVRRFIQGRARLSIRVRSTTLSSLMLRLSEPLAVTGVTSVEYGRLLYLRLNGQNALLINLPRVVPQDSDLTLVITYAGRVEPQALDVDTAQVEGQAPSEGGLQLEPHFLLSNRSFWYPQNPVPDYATATLRITVPPDYACVASGEPIAGDSVVSLRDIIAAPDGKVFAFRAAQPLRYLALVVSRMKQVAETTIAVTGTATEGTGVDRVAVTVLANGRQEARARNTVRATEEIIRFYTELVGDAPYTSATVALVEDEFPGGHAPGYFVVINNPLPNANTNTWRADPASFDNFPEFFLAHELAHQWWGQAVGWKNYHEQWLSEGFSQYFAALYAQRARGDRVFGDMLRQFRRWSIQESDQGPVYLGYRLGHIKSDLRVFRAIVYNKGAAVLHMLRRLIGDKPFFAGLRRFYMDRRYQKAGTDDFERAIEAESGRNLDRFFERWIYGTEIPRIAYRSSIGAGEVTVRFEQQGPLVFDLPVTVTLTYADGSTSETVVPVTDAVVERSIAVSAPVRQVQVNRDNASVAEFDEQR